MTRVAVVGSGPSGMYAADALADKGIEVDVFDRLPVPFGLVRYGVAPDHFSIRSVRDTLDQVWDRPGVRFIGNVDVGRDTSVAEMRTAYSAVVLAFGASSDRRLGIDGEDLPGSVAATDLVAWYTGHPDYAGPDFGSILRNSRRVAVIGVGNVAVDVVRVLSKSPEELASTDMPDHVLETLASITAEHVFLVGRRGPAQASFTTKELRELGELASAEVHVDTRDLEMDPVSSGEVLNNKVAARNVKVLEDWSVREPREASTQIQLKFFSRPTRIIGVEHVQGLVIERTEFDNAGASRGTGSEETLDVDLVVRSVGYQGVPMPGVPFDTKTHTIPNEDGRVVDDGEIVPGLYVTGWIKRGPSGVIGTNKKCASGTVSALVEDLAAGKVTGVNSEDFLEKLMARGVQPVTSEGWRKIDEQEKHRGRSAGKERVTIHEKALLMKTANG